MVKIVAMHPIHVRIHLERSLDAPRQGRRALEAIVGTRPELFVAVATIVLSELITTSVQQGATPTDHPIEVEVERDGLRLRLSVCGPDEGLDPQAVPRAGEVGGWGLFLVNSLASRWGISTNGHTQLWAELDLPGSDSSPYTIQQGTS